MKTYTHTHRVCIYWREKDIEREKYGMSDGEREKVHSSSIDT